MGRKTLRYLCIEQDFVLLHLDYWSDHDRKTLSGSPDLAGIKQTPHIDPRDFYFLEQF